MHGGVLTCVVGCLHAWWGAYMRGGVLTCMVGCLHAWWGACMQAQCGVFGVGGLVVCLVVIPGFDYGECVFLPRKATRAMSCVWCQRGVRSVFNIKASNWCQGGHKGSLVASLTPYKLYIYIHRIYMVLANSSYAPLLRLGALSQLICVALCVFLIEKELMKSLLVCIRCVSKPFHVGADQASC